MPKLKDIHAAIVKDNKAMKNDFKKAFKTTDRFAKKDYKNAKKKNQL